jgi:hypothetical protein
MKIRRFFKNKHAAVSSVELAISSTALIASIAVVIVSVAVPSGFIPVQQYVDADAKAQEITNILLSPSAGVGLAVDVETVLEEPSTIELPENTAENALPDLYVKDAGDPNDPNKWLNTIPEQPSPSEPFSINFVVTNSKTVTTDAIIDVKIGIFQTSIPDGPFGERPVCIGGINLDSGEHIIVVTIKPTGGDANSDDNTAEGTINIISGNNAPTPPELIDGPTVIIDGLTIIDDGRNYANVEYHFEVVSTDPDGNQISYLFDWGDGTSTVWSELYNSNEPHSASHEWVISLIEEQRTFDISVQAKDEHGAESEVLKIPITIFANSKPDGIITGPTTGSINVEYTFMVGLNEPDGENIYYKIVWGDGTPTSWNGPGSAPPVSFPELHTFTSAGTYEIVVTVVDIHGALDSDTHQIIIADELPKGKCFIAGTQIVMADSSLKNIEDMKVGDKIKSYDPATNLFKEDKVVHVFHDAPEMMMDDYYLLINNEVGVTTEHPLFINGKWIRADELKVGDPLAKGVVSSIEKVYKRVPTYNFETEIYHTYLVKSGDDLIIAHNVEYYYNSEPYKEDIVTESEQISATDDDYPAIISMGKIESLREYSYDYLSNLFGMPAGYNFLITIINKNSVFAVVGEDGISVEGSNVRAAQKESVIIYDSSNNQYIFAILQITIFK